jgi:hypothetical protein
MFSKKHLDFGLVGAEVCTLDGDENAALRFAD